MLKPNPETSYYEVVKIVFERSGVEKDLQRMDVVQGEDRAADRAAHFDRRMTEEERQEGAGGFQRRSPVGGAA